MRELVIEKEFHKKLQKDCEDILLELYLRSSAIGVGVKQFIFMIEENEIEEILELMSEYESADRNL